jgi:carbonic anhydrase
MKTNNTTITQSRPGDLFVVKNLGKLVPPATATGSTNSTAAAIEQFQPIERS